MKFPSKALIGFFIFISIYIGALYAFAVNVPPGTVLDPAGLPGAYTVRVLGFDSDGFIDTDAIQLANSSTGQFTIGDTNSFGGSSGPALFYERGGQYNGLALGDLTNGGVGDQAAWLGYLEPGVTENSLRITPSYSLLSAIDDTLGKSTSLILQSTQLAFGAEDGADAVDLELSTAFGLVLTGKDDLSSSATFTVNNDSGDSLIQVKNDGTFESTRETASGIATTGNFDFMHPFLPATVNAVGSRVELASGTESFDSGVFDLGGGFASGQHYIDTATGKYVGFDVNTSDSSLFYINFLTNTSSSITAGDEDIMLSASPDGATANYINIFNNSDGIIFHGLDDLTTSVLAQFENASGDELLQIKNDGTFVSETAGGLQLLNKTGLTLTVIGAVPYAGSFYSDSDSEYVNGIVDFSGLGGDIFPEMARIDKNTLDSYYFTVDQTAARMGFSNNYGAGGNHNFAVGATGAQYSALDDLATTEGFRIENDSDTTLLSVYNDGVVIIPNMITTESKSGSNQTGSSVTLAGGKGTGVASGGSIIFQTADAYAVPAMATVVHAAPTTKLTIAGSGNVTMASRDKGNGVAGSVLEIGRNTNGTNTGAGSVNFLSKSGTAGYVWQDAAGNMRINTSAPSHANDTAGTVIGDQTSTRETKQDITDYTDYAGALSKIIAAPLHMFRYIREVQGYGADSPLAKNRLGYIADEVDPIFMTGNSIDQVSVNGLLMASVKELNLQIQSIASLTADASFIGNLRSFFADAANGIGDFFANRVRTKAICLSDDSGAETCVTKSDLDAILQGNTASSGGSTNTDPSPSNPIPETEEPTTDTTDGSQTDTLEELPVETDPGSSEISPENTGEENSATPPQEEAAE